jgi:hypothetical protein
LGHKPTCKRAKGRSVIPSLSDPDFDSGCEKNCSAQVIVIGKLPGFFYALEQWTVVGCFLDREVNLVLKNNAKGVTPHINRAYSLANQLSGELVSFTCKPICDSWPWATVVVMKRILYTTPLRYHPFTRSPDGNNQPL